MKKTADILLIAPKKVEKTKEQLEFEQYADMIKKKIVEVCQIGLRDQAIELLNSYKQINPSDKAGISELERALGIDN